MAIYAHAALDDAGRGAALRHAPQLPARFLCNAHVMAFLAAAAAAAETDTSCAAPAKPGRAISAL